MISDYFAKLKVFIYKNKYLQEIIDEQQNTINKIAVEYVGLYNAAIVKIVSESNNMILFNDSSYSEFNGILGLKFDRQQKGYKKDFEEIIIMFPNGATYYWYFYKLGQKMIAQKPIDNNIKAEAIKSKVKISAKNNIPKWIQNKLK